METGALSTGRRSAGQYARSQANALVVRMFVAIGFSLLVLFVAWSMLGGRGPILVLIELAAIGAIVAADRMLAPRADRWLRGARGEERVGAVLDGLSGRGWLAIHDVSLGRGNVDHVVVGPGGVFAVETKSHKGRIGVDKIDPRMLKQAYAESKLLERITGMEAEALLVFSEAWLVGSVPARRRGVTVLPARMLAGYLERRRPVMSVQEARGVGERLAAALGQAPSAL
jgi:Nuclease-related domain